MKSILQFVKAGFIYFVAWLFFLIVLVMSTASFASTLANNRYTFITLITFLSFCVPAFIWIKRNKLSLSFMKLNHDIDIKDRTIQVIGILGFDTFMVLVSSILLSLFVTVESNVTPATNVGSLFIDIIIIGLIGPFFEEFFFRGLLLDRLSVYGPKVSIIIISLIFGILHFNWVASVSTVIMSLLLCTYRIKNKDLYTCLAVHILFNITSTLGAYFDGNFYDIYAIIISIVSFIVIVVKRKEIIQTFKEVWLKSSQVESI